MGQANKLVDGQPNPAWKANYNYAARVEPSPVNPTEPSQTDLMDLRGGLKFHKNAFALVTPPITLEEVESICKELEL